MVRYRICHRCAISHSFHKRSNLFCLGPQQARRINRNEANDAQIPRRAQIARNQRRNAPNQAANTHEDSADSDGEPDRPSPFVEGAKIGAKKRAKLEAKAEKRVQREQEQIAREEKKKKDAVLEAERKKAEQVVEVSGRIPIGWLLNAMLAYRFEHIRRMKNVSAMKPNGWSAKRRHAKSTKSI